MQEYEFKTTPFKHQEVGFFATRDLQRVGIFWEQRCGKTKLMIDTAAYLYEKGLINGLLILAPSGVHRNWISDEIPVHMPDRIPLSAHVYYTSKAGTIRHRKECERLLGVGGLAVLAMTYSAFITKHGRKMAEDFLEKRKVLYVADEAHRIKSPNAKRTKAILASAKLAPFRRILTGTPIANGPFDAYSIMKFLNLEFWKPYYLDSYFIFKHHFGIFKKLEKKDAAEPANKYREPEYCVAYRNLEQLNEILGKHGSRVTKDQVLQLPPKLYSKRYFELTPEQQRLYGEVKHEFMTELQGDLITAPLAITRLLRLQQITSGYIPSDAGDPIYTIGEANPRLQLLEEILEDEPHKAIIWAKFRREINEICGLLGDRCVRYDGDVNEEQRIKNLDRFKKGDAQFFICNVTINEGLNLNVARTVIYYSNSFKLTDRLQSEDRPHGPGQKYAVNYIDLVGEDTVDEYIIDKLVKKSDIAGTILGDDLKQWIRK